jgi:hypothetical protein
MTPVEIMLSGAVGVLTSAIAYLFRDYQSRFQALDQKLSRAESEIRECERDRERLWEELLKLERAAGYSPDKTASPYKRSAGLQRAADRHDANEDEP